MIVQCLVVCCLVSLIVSNHLDGEGRADCFGVFWGFFWCFFFCFVFFLPSGSLVNVVWLFLMVPWGFAYCS